MFLYTWWFQQTTKVLLDMRTTTISARVLLSLSWDIQCAMCTMLGVAVCLLQHSTRADERMQPYVQPYSIHCTTVFVCVLSMLPYSFIIQSALARRVAWEIGLASQNTGMSMDM